MTAPRARRGFVLGGFTPSLLIALVAALLTAATIAAAAPITAIARAASPTAAVASASHSLDSMRMNLARSTRALARCRHSRPGRCSRQLRAYKQARRRVHSAEAALSRYAKIASRYARSSDMTAPTLSVSKDTLTWNKIASVTRYVLMTKAPGKSAAYREVDGTSVTPSAVPGATVRYSVRTDASGSAWSAEAEIAYPAVPSEPSPPATTGSGSKTEVTTSKTETSSTKTVTVTTKTETSGSGSSPTGSESKTGTTGGGGTTETEANLSTFGPFIKGVNTNMEGWGTSSVPQIASEMNTLGANWAREEIAWAEVEPTKGVFNWSTVDKTFAAAKANGITILPVVGYAPSWASPTDSADYAAFVQAAVERYGPGTSYNLQWFELWNEPYDSYAWSGHTPEPEAYARDVLAAAQAAKGASPTVKVLISADYRGEPQAGGLTSSETSWIPSMFAAVPNLGQWIDGVSVHPYGGDPALPLASPTGWTDTNGKWSFRRIDMIRTQFLEHGVNVPFWITEDGWSTVTVTEAEQAKDYTDLVTQIQARPWIRALFPYCLREFSSNASDQESAYGLLKFGTWAPRPAFAALQAGFKVLD